MSFSGKVVLITGGGSGIGADVARQLAELGASVSIVDRNAKGLSEVSAAFETSGLPSPLTIVADITTDTDRIVSETIEKFGKLDVLINNAGFGINDTVIDANLDDFDRVFSTNVRSVIALTQLCVPYLAKTKGNVVNVSSICSLKAVPRFMSYCMSKAALDQFTKCSALDLAPLGIRVNSINPSAVRTSFLQSLGVSQEEADKSYEDKKGDYPLGRVGEVKDTSTAIAFLADDSKASFLTGVLLKVDGGRLLGCV